MCTVLQQHLNRQNGMTNGDSNGPTTTNGYGTVSVSPSPAGGRAESVALTPAPIGGVSSYWVRHDAFFQTILILEINLAKYYKKSNE